MSSFLYDLTIKDHLELIIEGRKRTYPRVLNATLNLEPRNQLYEFSMVS